MKIEKGSISIIGGGILLPLIALSSCILIIPNLSFLFYQEETQMTIIDLEDDDARKHVIISGVYENTYTNKIYNIQESITSLKAKEENIQERKELTIFYSKFFPEHVYLGIKVSPYPIFSLILFTIFLYLGISSVIGLINYLKEMKNLKITELKVQPKKHIIDRSK